MRTIWRKSKTILALLLALCMVTSGTDLTVLAEEPKFVDTVISDESIPADGTSIPEAQETDVEETGGKVSCPRSMFRQRRMQLNQRKMLQKRQTLRRWQKMILM